MLQRRFLQTSLFLLLLIAFFSINTLTANAAISDGLFLNNSWVNSSNQFKTELHTHTSESEYYYHYEGYQTPEQTLTDYKANGYSVVALTDYGVVTTPSSIPSELLWIPGVENAKNDIRDTIPGGTYQGHLNAFNVSVAQTGTTVDQDIAQINAVNGIAQLNHPNWSYNPYTYEELATIRGYTLIEVQNPTDWTKYDWLLSTQNIKPWATMTTDLHDSSTLTPTGYNFIVINADNLATLDIYDALRNGNFYLSTGATITSITTSGRTISIIVPTNSEITWYRDNGTIIKTTESATVDTYTVNGDEKYVRIKVKRLSDNQYAYSQPITIEHITKPVSNDLLINYDFSLDTDDLIVDNTLSASNLTNHGSVLNTLTSGAKTRTFDGTDYANGSGAELNITHDITVEYWVNQKTASAANAYLIGRGYRYPGAALYNRLMKVGYTWDDSTNNYLDATGMTGGQLTLNNWHHGAISRDQATGNVTFLADNNLIGNLTGYTQDMKNNSGNIYMGGADATTSLINADIAVIRVYSGTMTLSEFQTNEQADAWRFGNAITAPETSFTINEGAGYAPTLITADDTSTNNPIEWEWDFGDGTPHIYRQDATHIYQESGTYTITLTSSNLAGTDTDTYEITIEDAPPAPTANFTADNFSGIKPLTVNFTDLSEGTIDTYAWNFGDGSDNVTTQNCSHVFADNGTYAVILTVSNDGGESSIEQTITVNNPAAPVSNFNATALNSINNRTITFTDLSTGLVDSRTWDFGDGTTSTEQNPTHTYDHGDNYQVSLTVSNDGGSNTMTQTIPVYGDMARWDMIGGQTKNVVYLLLIIPIALVGYFIIRLFSNEDVDGNTLMMVAVFALVIIIVVGILLGVLGALSHVA